MQTSRRYIAFSVLALMLAAPMISPAAASAQPELGDRRLSLGSWGADVFALQQSLIRAGYEITSDGHFGKQTRAAVVAFQVANGLKPDGVVGETTISALESIRPTFEYVVQPGDSLWEIAKRYNTSMEELVAINNLPTGPLRVGTTMHVPKPPTYTVKPGDTLIQIARTYRATVDAIVSLNDIDDPNLIRAGTVLRLPRGSAETQPGF